MRITQFLWEDDTIEHLAQHSVEPGEAEQICQGRPYALRTHGGRYLILGQTQTGRYLTVVAAPLGKGRAKIITARDMDAAERRRYLSR